MTDQQALMSAILASPDEDTPRLVYADYLDEQGGEGDTILAKYIRTQVELARLNLFNPARHPLAREVRRLEHPTRLAKWSRGLDGLVLMTRFERGFVAEVTMYSKRFVAEGEKLFAVQPIRAVKFADMTGGRGAAPPDELFACPHLARLHTVQFVGMPVDDAFVAHLVRSPHLGKIRCVRLGRCMVSPAGLRRILEAKNLPSLCEIDVRESPDVGSKHLVELAASKSLSRIRSLSFRTCTVGAEGAAALARSKHAASLEVLRIGHDPTPTGQAPLRGPGAVSLAESPHLRGLKELVLKGQELRKKGAESFAKSYAWSGLKRLSLRGNGIPASALPPFAANPAFGSLEELDLTSSPIKEQDIEPLRQAFPRTVIVTDDTHWDAYQGLSSEDEA